MLVANFIAAVKQRSSAGKVYSVAGTAPNQYITLNGKALWYFFFEGGGVVGKNDPNPAGDGITLTGLDGTTAVADVKTFLDSLNSPKVVLSEWSWSQ